MMDDLISRQAAIDALTEYGNGRAVYISVEEAFRRIKQLPSAQQTTCKYWDAESDFCTLYRPSAQPVIISTPSYTVSVGEPMEYAPIVRCKDCKHFHYDMPYVIQGVPVLGHEVCDFWGDGCKTSENGFCSYAERRTDEAD